MRVNLDAPFNLLRLVLPDMIQNQYGRVVYTSSTAGLVAEHAGFADLCRDLGVVFIGPRPEVMRRLGDKITSKRLAERAGVSRSSRSIRASCTHSGFVLDVSQYHGCL